MMQNSIASELERRVDEALFYLWDPLGFNGEPFAREEYRSYVKEVLHLVKGGKNSEKIAELLTDIVENRMGLEFSREISLSVGKALVRHRTAIDPEAGEKISI